MKKLWKLAGKKIEYSIIWATFKETNGIIYLGILIFLWIFVALLSFLILQSYDMRSGWIPAAITLCVAAPTVLAIWFNAPPRLSFEVKTGQELGFYPTRFARRPRTEDERVFLSPGIHNIQRIQSPVWNKCPYWYVVSAGPDLIGCHHLAFRQTLKSMDIELKEFR